MILKGILYAYFHVKDSKGSVCCAVSVAGPMTPGTKL